MSSCRPWLTACRGQGSRGDERRNDRLDPTCMGPWWPTASSRLHINAAGAARADDIRPPAERTIDAWNHRRFNLLATPVPIGQRRSSGVSAPYSTYPDDDELLVDVTVIEVKEGCALGLVLEHLDEAGAVIAAESVSTYSSPRTHRFTTTAKGCRLRIVWVLTGLKPSSTFGVVTEGMPSPAAARSSGAGDAESAGLDLTTLEGLRAYVGLMTQEGKSRN